MVKGLLVGVCTALVLQIPALAQSTCQEYRSSLPSAELAVDGAMAARSRGQLQSALYNLSAVVAGIKVYCRDGAIQSRYQMILDRVYRVVETW